MENESVETIEEEHELQNEVETPVIAPEVEQEALDTGWLPLESYKGDPKNWRPADEWVKRGNEIRPIMKTQIKKYAEEVNTLKAAIEEQKKTTERILKMSEKAQEQAYEKAKHELLNQQKQAVLDGDVEEWQRIETEREKLVKPEAPIETEAPKIRPEFPQWHAQNDWYIKDEDMTLFADSVGKAMLDKEPNMDYSIWLAKISDKVKSAFPHKFTNPNRENPAAVDSGSQRGVDVSASKPSYANLPADAKAQCDIYIKNGLYKSRDDYARVYFEEA